MRNISSSLIREWIKSGSYVFHVSPVMVFVAPAMLGANALGAHQGERLYPVREITTEMLTDIDLHDGSIAEWERWFGSPPITLLDFDIATHHTEISEHDPSDLDFGIWLGWTQSPARLYIAVLRSDDVYLNSFRSSDDDDHGRHDSFWVLVDGDHGGGLVDVDDEGPTGANKRVQYYTSLPEVSEGSTIIMNWTDAQWPFLPPFADGGGGSAGENPVISVTEFYVTPFDEFSVSGPDDSRISDFRANAVIGLNMVMVDYDTRSNIHGLYELPQQPLESPNADNFADAILLPAKTERDGGTAVSSVSWARIKTSMNE